MSETPQAVRDRGDRIHQPLSSSQSRPQSQRGTLTVVVAQKGPEGREGAAVKQSQTLAPDIKALTHSNPQRSEKSFASVTASTSSSQERTSAEITREPTKRPSDSQQAKVKGQSPHFDNGASRYPRGRNGPRYRPCDGKCQSVISELRKKLESCQQEKDAMAKAKDSAQKKLDEAERRYKNLEEQNKRQSEELRTVINHLRQAESLHRQTLDLLEVKTSELKGAHAFQSTEDSLSGADLIGMVDVLNAEILQVAAFMADSLESVARVSRPAVQTNTIQPKSYVNLGEHIVRALKLHHTEFNPLPVQIALQVCLVSVSSWIIQSWIPGLWDYDRLFSAIHADIRAKEGQMISRRWRAITCGRLKQYWKKYENKMMAFISSEIANVLTLAGQPRSLIEGEFLDKFRDRLTVIVQSALRINEATSVDITSKDLQLMIISPGVAFDTHNMDDGFSQGDSFKSRGKDRHNRVDRVVAGTTDIGIQSIVGSSSVPEILKKPKVIQTRVYICKEEIVLL